MLKKGLENNYEDSNRCKHSKPAIDIFKAGRGRNTPKSNTDVAWSRKTHLFIAGIRKSGKTINVDAKIKQLNDINWIEIGYKEGDTFSVYGKEYAIDSSGHINVSAEDEFTSTEIKYPSRSI